MNVAILYICTGKYTIFWKGFYASASKFLFPGIEKRFFVFSDGDTSLFEGSDITLIPQENLGWPDNTLKRFHIFLQAEEALRHYDYIFFFNANCVFVAPVGAEMLPSPQERMVVVRHPGYYNTSPINFPYDRNPRSLAYIPWGKGEHYVAGGVNGGCTAAYLEYIHDMVCAVDTDAANGIMARWHDESHLNKYILTHPCKILSPSYCYAEEIVIPFPCIIRVLNKRRFGALSWLRGASCKVSPEMRPPLWVRVCRVLYHLCGKQ